MKEMPDNSVDSIITDPPYELGFMGKKWDNTGIPFNIEVWQEALRVLKPGGHLLAFSGSRTYHRMAVAIEDAGFEVRDQIMWIYGSGFPKSMDVSKAIDKAVGAEREVVGTRKMPGYAKANVNNGQQQRFTTEFQETSKIPATDAAKQWQGWGTALKPAHEPIVLARKPLIGTVASNVLTYGTGGLNIDGSRVDYNGEKPSGWFDENERKNAGFKLTSGSSSKITSQPNSGRWPANIIHDGSDEVLELFGEPARFFYCAKASKRDRNEGLEGFEAKGKVFNGQSDSPAGKADGSVEDKFSTKPQSNFHPTVKPTDLMRYLVKLITPPNGTVLDPFMGSGSTGKACAIEGFDFIGIEQDADYVEIARARISHVQRDDLLF